MAPQVRRGFGHGVCWHAWGAGALRFPNVSGAGDPGAVDMLLLLPPHTHTHLPFPHPCRCGGRWQTRGPGWPRRKSCTAAQRPMCSRSGHCSGWQSSEAAAQLAVLACLPGAPGVERRCSDQKGGPSSPVSARPPQEQFYSEEDNAVTRSLPPRVHQPSQGGLPEPASWAHPAGLPEGIPPTSIAASESPKPLSCALWRPPTPCLERVSAA